MNHLFKSLSGLQFSLEDISKGDDDLTVRLPTFKLKLKVQ